MEQKLYNLKMKILKDKSINDNLKKELADEIFQIEKEVAINYNQCCTQLKDKEALSFDGFVDEFYYKAQMGIYESKATGMFYNLNDLQKRYQKYCLRF